VVTHAGHGTVIKAWPRGATGLPPAGSRSEGQRGPVQRLGAGIRLGKRATSAAIASAVRHVIDNNQYGNAAAAFAAQLAVESATTPSAADEAEALLSID